MQVILNEIGWLSVSMEVATDNEAALSRREAAREQVQPSALYAELLQEASVLVRGHRGRAALHRRAAISVVASAPAGVATAAAAALSAP